MKVFPFASNRAQLSERPVFILQKKFSRFIFCGWRMFEAGFVKKTSIQFCKTLLSWKNEIQPVNIVMTCILSSFSFACNSYVSTYCSVSSVLLAWGQSVSLIRDWQNLSFVKTLSFFYRDTWASEGGCMRVQPFCTVKFDIFLIKF